MWRIVPVTGCSHLFPAILPQRLHPREATNKGTILAILKCYKNVGSSAFGVKWFTFLSHMKSVKITLRVWLDGMEAGSWSAGDDDTGRHPEQCASPSEATHTHLHTNSPIVHNIGMSIHIIPCLCAVQGNRGMLSPLKPWLKKSSRQSLIHCLNLEQMEQQGNLTVWQCWSKPINVEPDPLALGWGVLAVKIARWRGGAGFTAVLVRGYVVLYRSFTDQFNCEVGVTLRRWCPRWQLNYVS